MTLVDLVRTYENAADKCFIDWMKNDLNDISISEAMKQAGVRAVVRALRDELELTRKMLMVQSAEAFPEINEHGQKHFLRVVMESAAEEIDELFGAAIPAEEKAAGGPTPDNGRPLVEGADKETSQAAAPAANPVCEWTPDKKYPKFWETCCAGLWPSFNGAPTPSQCGYKFCPSCGLSIKFVERS